jgi:hypothetical protein
MRDGLESREEIAAAIQGVTTEMETRRPEENDRTRLMASEGAGMQGGQTFRQLEIWTEVTLASPSA